MNQLSEANGMTDYLYDNTIESMFDNTNIFVLIELYYRESSYTHQSDFLDRLTKYLKKHGMI